MSSHLHHNNAAFLASFPSQEHYQQQSAKIKVPSFKIGESKMQKCVWCIWWKNSWEKKQKKNNVVWRSSLRGIRLDRKDKFLELFPVALTTSCRICDVQSILCERQSQGCPFHPIKQKDPVTNQLDQQWNPSTPQCLSSYDSIMRISETEHNH